MTVRIDGTNTEANPAFTGADTNTGLQCGTNDQLKLVTGGTSRLKIDGDGRVGVGSSAPYNVLTGKSLSIGNGVGAAEINFLSATDGYGSLYFGDGTSGNAKYRGYLEFVHSDESMRFGTAATEVLRIDSSGRVGIGTPSPGNPLHIANENPSIRLQANSGSYQGRNTLGQFNNILYLECDNDNAVADSAMAFTVDATERFRIGSDGQFTTNGVKQYFDRGAAQGTSSFSRDFTLGGTQSALVIMAFNHYGLFGYGCSRMSFAATGSSFSTETIHNQSTGNGGSWDITKPNNSTIRVTKNAGSYGGSGHWFIHVISS